MYFLVRVNAKVIEDDTGIKCEIPILLTETGEHLALLTNFLLHKQQEGKSRSWMERVVRAIHLMMDYMEANKSGFSDPQTFFQTFAKRLYTGTIGEDGLDPSWLYWIPASTKTTDQLVYVLTQFLDWVARKSGVQHMNPLVQADSHTQRLNYAAWFKKNQHNFLGHIEEKSVNQVVRRARLIKGRRQHTLPDDDAIAFNEKDFAIFFREGIGGAKDPRVALRDQLILLLMHNGGLRKSEALALWTSDVFEDPSSPDTALVRIYHPENGAAPHNWRGRNGSKHRAAYLLENYALTPRNRLEGTQWLGWKTRVMDNKDNYIQVHWFPKDYGILFMLLWKNYLHFITPVERPHPYAFISFHYKYRGKPYTIHSFDTNYGNALRRIGLSANKSLGYGPHGHRHSYGRRLKNAGLDPFIIKKCMHHSSLESQLVYTSSSLTEVSNQLTEATKRLDELSKIEALPAPVPDWKSLVEHGFEDIDPEGYFTGKHPKFRSK